MNLEDYHDIDDEAFQKLATKEDHKIIDKLHLVTNKVDNYLQKYDF
jgi:hypothetical protein